MFPMKYQLASIDVGSSLAWCGYPSVPLCFHLLGSSLVLYCFILGLFGKEKVFSENFIKQHVLH